MRPSSLPLLTVAAAIVVSLASTNTLAQGAAASVPRLVNFVGVATDANGQPRKGIVRITFAIYADAEGGAPIWQETQRLPLSGGQYQALLGGGTPHGLPADLFTSGEARWLGIQIANDPEQRPRMMLLSVPYALKAQDSDRLGGRDVTEFVLAASVDDTASSGGTSGGGSGNSAPKSAQSFTATASPGFISTAAVGAPLSVNSWTLVARLNADLLDGMHAADIEAHAQALVDEEAGKRGAADAQERAARLEGDAVMQKGLEAETIGRQAADEAEGVVRGNRDNELQSAIDAERAERASEAAVEKADKELLKHKVDVHKQQSDDKSLALDQKIDGKSSDLHTKTDALDQKFVLKTDALDQKILQEKTALKSELEGKILAEKQQVKGELETKIAIEKASLQELIFQEKGLVKGDLETQIVEKELSLKGDYESKINQKELFLKGDYEEKISAKEASLKADYEFKIGQKESSLKNDYDSKIGLLDQKLSDKEHFLKSDYDFKIAQKEASLKGDYDSKILETKTKVDNHKASGDHDTRYVKKSKAVVEHKTDATIEGYVIVSLEADVAPDDEGRMLIMAIVGGTSTDNPDVPIVFGLFVDDVVQDSTIVRYSSTGDVRQITLSRMLELPAGVHTISVRWQPNAVADVEPVLSVGAGGSSKQILVLPH